jgi:hypothetical protein
MNNLRRGWLGILAVLITVTLSACSEGQGKSHKQRELTSCPACRIKQLRL